MHSFVDGRGESWELRGTFLSYSRVRDRTGIDLTDIASEEQSCLKRFAADQFAVLEVIWVMVSEQAEKRSVSKDEFLDRFTEQTLSDAIRALVSEMLFFSQKGSPTHTVLKVVAENFGPMQEAMRKRTEDLEPMIRGAVQREMESLSAPGISGGSGPESRASTETPTA